MLDKFSGTSRTYLRQENAIIVDFGAGYDCGPCPKLLPYVQNLQESARRGTNAVNVNEYLKSPFCLDVSDEPSTPAVVLVPCSGQ